MRVPWCACLGAAILSTACGDGSKNAFDPYAADANPLGLVNFNESFIVGPRPITVLIVRHAQPSQIELDYSHLVGQAWLDGMRGHDAPWHIGILPIGADTDVVPLGGLVQTESGGRFVHNGNTDPDGLLARLLEPIDGTPGHNPLFTTLNAMSGIPANDAFILRNSLFVIHVVSALEDGSQMGAADDLEDWLREDTYYGWAATEFCASTNLHGSTCMGGDSDIILGMVAAIGGFQQDICDDSAPERAATAYTRSMTTYSMRLSSRPYQFTIEVTSPAWHGKDLVLDEDFDYTAYDNEVTLTSWQPKDLTQIWVRYVPIL